MKERIKEIFPDLEISLRIDERKIAHLDGECNTWQEVVDLGHLVAESSEIRNVVNNLTVKGIKTPKREYSQDRELGKAKGVIDNVDIVIIGAGVTGAAVSRVLAKYDLKILVLERENDVATGASKANNGDIHPGHAAKPGTLKAKLNVIGNRMYTQWSEELSFDLDRCGALGVVCKEEHAQGIKLAYKVAQINQVDGARLVKGDEVFDIEPKLRKQNIKPYLSLWLPSMGLVEPYQVTIAMAENAIANGVSYRFNTSVADIICSNDRVEAVVTNQGIIKCSCVINCAGIYADEISKMAGDNSYTLHNRKGVIALIDKNVEPQYESMTMIYGRSSIQKKNTNSKGGGMCRTVERNILLGPSAIEVMDKEDTSVSEEELSYALGRNENPEISRKNIIRIFAGARPADYKEDFVIEMSDVTEGFVNVGAIQSPGLAAAPAVATYVEDIMKKYWKDKAIEVKLKSNYNPRREAERPFNHLSIEEKAKLIEKDPSFARIICRCETVSEGEIIRAIRSPLKPRSIDGIKRRTRSGMGRCQGSFCQSKIVELIAKEDKISPCAVDLEYKNSNPLLSNNRRVNK